MNPSTLTGKHFEERFQVAVPDSCVKRDVETQRFGNDFTISNAPKRRYLYANCVPTRYCNCVSSWQLRVNRLHHEMLWYLAAGNASMAYAVTCNMKRFIRQCLVQYVLGSWQCITHAKAETQAGNKSHVQLYVTSIQGCLCSICDNRPMHLCVPLLPCGALVPGSWQCITHTEAKTQAFGPNAPKHRWLFFSVCHASNESVCTMPHFSVLELAGCCMELCSMK